MNPSQPSETESVPIGSKSVDQPICCKCGKPMSPEDSTIHPELFMHDACLPTELLLREVQAQAPVAGVEKPYKALSFDEFLRQFPIQARKRFEEHVDEIATLTTRVAELTAEVEAERAKRKEMAKDFETAFRVVRQENDQLHAELQSAKESLGKLRVEAERMSGYAQSAILLGRVSGAWIDGLKEYVARLDAAIAGQDSK